MSKTSLIKSKDWESEDGEIIKDGDNPSNNTWIILGIILLIVVIVLIIRNQKDKNANRENTKDD